MKIANIIKGVVLGCAVCASALTASADSLMFDNPDNKAYFGARVALDISSAANGGDFYSNKTGFAVGAIYNIPIKANFYFEPGLSLFYDVFGTMILKMDYPSSAPGSTIEPGSPDDLEGARMYQIDGTIRNLGFRVPLNFGYHFDFGEDLRVRVFTGPQINVSYFARYYQNRTYTPFSGEIKSSSRSAFGTGGFKHFDAQWNIGAGLDYGNYSIDLAGSIGMTRLCDAVEPFRKNIRRNIFSITLGYNF